MSEEHVTLERMEQRSSGTIRPLHWPPQHTHTRAHDSAWRTFMYEMTSSNYVWPAGYVMFVTKITKYF